MPAVWSIHRPGRIKITRDQDKSCQGTTPSHYGGTFNGTLEFLRTNLVGWKAKSSPCPAPSNGLRNRYDGVIFLGQCQSKERKEEVLCLKYEVLVWCFGRKQSTSLSALSLPSRFVLEVSSTCTWPDVRWSLLHLWSMYPRFKSLKFGCYLGNEEDLV